MNLKKNFIVMALCIFSLTGFAKTTTVDVKNQTVEISFSPESRIKIDGDSTLRKFSAVADTFELKAKALDKAETLTKLPWTPTELEMVLAVKNLKSGEETLDDHMHENLKADKYPQIQLKLSGFTFLKSDDGKSDLVKASGTLTIAGVTKPIELNANLTNDGANLRIKGNRLVLMSDYGIDPPTMMMGTLKTRNEIEISFEVICIINNKQKG